VHGETADSGDNVVDHPVLVNDPNATVLRRMGNDHERSTSKFQGLGRRLSGVEPA
jgi:hypothetical protein